MYTEGSADDLVVADFWKRPRLCWLITRMTVEGFLAREKSSVKRQVDSGNHD